MAGQWVVRYQDAQSGRKSYFARHKKKPSLTRERWYPVNSPVTAKKWFRQEQAETAAFNLATERPHLIGKLTVVAWDGNAKSKP